MAITTSQVSVSTSATLLATGAGAGDNKMQVTVRHASATATVVGTSAVTTGNGYTLAQSTSETFLLKQGDVLYGICAAGTVAVNVIQVW